MKYSRMDTVASRAFDKMDKSEKVDLEFDTYSKLTPEDLQKLSELYGQEEVDKYIKEMEQRRVKYGR